jgi:hypothetical protein
MGTIARRLGVRGASRCRHAPKIGRPVARSTRAPAGGIEPPSDRLTAGCLTIRLRWNETARPRACSTSAPRTRTSLSKRQVFREHGPRAGLPARGFVPGAGVEPAFLDSETSVLPARRSRSDESDVACEGHTSPGRSGGNRTLTTSIKSRVRLPITLRTRANARGCRASGGMTDTRESTSWDARESNPHPSG